MDTYGQNVNVNIGQQIVEAIRRATQSATQSSSQQGGFNNVYRSPGMYSGGTGAPGAPGQPGAASSGGTRPQIPGRFQQYLNGNVPAGNGASGGGMSPGWSAPDLSTMPQRPQGPGGFRQWALQDLLPWWRAGAAGVPQVPTGPPVPPVPGLPPPTTGGVPRNPNAAGALVPGMESSGGNVPGPWAIGSPGWRSHLR